MPAMCLNCANSSPVTKSGSNISVPSDKKAAETELVAIQTERDGLSARTAALEGEVKRLRRELEDEKEKTTQLKEAEVRSSIKSAHYSRNENCVDDVCRSLK